MSLEAAARSVRGVLSAAATAKAAVMPGTISKGMRCSVRAAISSPARPKMRGSPDLRRRTERFFALDGACVLQHEVVDAGLSDARLAAALADGDDEGGWAGEGEDLVGDEVVGEDDVAVWRRRSARRVRRSGSPGPAPTR
jgi:hypothetical protein